MQGINLHSVSFKTDRYGRPTDKVIQQIAGRFTSMVDDLAIMGESMPLKSRVEWSKVDAMDTVSYTLIELGFEYKAVSEFVNINRSKLAGIALKFSGINERKYNA